MGVLSNNYAQIGPGALISASYVSDIYDVLMGTEREDIAISGSLNVTGSIYGNLTGTASNSISSSFAVSASYALNSENSIFAETASYSTSASFAETASYSIIHVESITSSSFAETASFALSANTYTYEIGEYAPSEGGVIFHRYKDGGQERYLVVDIDDLNGGVDIEWSNITDQLAGADSTWDGLSNSNSIVGQSGHTSSAALLCSGSTNGGKSDWYLPAIDELSLLWQNRFNVNRTLSTIGGATEILYNNYWSSSESGENYSFLFDFYTGGSGNGSKVSSNLVRAVRKFSI
jgi:hypothetical protein